MNVQHRLLSSSTDMPWLVSGLQVGSYCVIDDSDRPNENSCTT